MVTLDVRPECKATYTVDIRKWHFWRFCEQGKFELVCASISCTEFSQALTTRQRDLGTADSIARRNLKIIRWLNPRKYFIKNPAGSALLQNRSYMEGIPKIRVDYCQFQLNRFMSDSDTKDDRLSSRKEENEEEHSEIPERLRHIFADQGPGARR